MNRIPVEMLRFSTDEFPAHQRIDAYREIYGRVIIKHDVEAPEDRPFHFEGNLHGLPNLGLASYVITTCRAARGPKHIDSDDLVLSINLSGERTIQQSGREAVMHTGEAVLTTSDAAGLVTIASTCRLLSLRIPRSVVRSTIADLDSCLLRPIPRDTPALPLLTGYIGVILNDNMLAKPVMRDLVVAHVHDLVCLALGAKDEFRKLAEERGVGAARRSAILREIDRRSYDPGVSANKIAHLLGVTPRYVHLLLEETGKSFTHHVLERRLDKAAALLRDPRGRDRKIADIAAEAGFTDLSYFNRSFRRHFGATPSDIREAAKIY
jgi:AraC-like DNA-binding protein